MLTQYKCSHNTNAQTRQIQICDPGKSGLLYFILVFVVQSKNKRIKLLILLTVFICSRLCCCTCSNLRPFAFMSANRKTSWKKMPSKKLSASQKQLHHPRQRVHIQQQPTSGLLFASPWRHCIQVWYPNVIRAFPKTFVGPGWLLVLTLSSCSGIKFSKNRNRRPKPSLC